MENKELSTKYLFEKLIEREDKMLDLFERIDESLDGLKNVISDHNYITTNYNKNSSRERKELKEEVKGFACLQRYFSIAFGVLILFAFGTEFIGRENIVLFIEKLMGIK